jgi:hypothetical protein
MKSDGRNEGEEDPRKTDRYRKSFRIQPGRIVETLHTKFWKREHRRRSPERQTGGSSASMVTAKNTYKSEAKLVSPYSLTKSTLSNKGTRKYKKVKGKKGATWL